MRSLPAGFANVLAEIKQSIQHVEGWLKRCEVDFLALLAACPTTAGEVLEIGSYHGKSTIALAKAAAAAGAAPVVTVDPLPMHGAREALDQTHTTSRNANRIHVFGTIKG